MSARDFRIFVIITFFTQMYVSVFFLYPLAIQKQGGTLDTAGMLMAAFFIAATAVRPLAGMMTEKLGVRRTMLLASTALTLASLPLVWVQGSLYRLVLRALMGAFYSICMVALTSYQAIAVPLSTRGSSFAIIAAAYVLPQVTIVPVADLLIAWGYFKLFLLTAPFFSLLCVISSLYASDSPIPIKRGEENEWGTWAELFRLDNLVFLLTSVWLFAIVNSTTLQYVPSHIGAIGLIPSAFLVPNAIAALGIRIVAQNFMNVFPRKLMTGISSGIMAGMLLLTPHLSTNFGLVIAGAVYGVGMGFGFPVQLALMPDILPKRLLPKGVSLSFFSMDMAWIMSSFAVSWFAGSIGLQNIILSTGSIGLITAMLLLWMNFRIRIMH